MAQVKTLFGKFRGTVVNTADPEGLGRIQAQVPDVTPRRPSTWALPCAPVAGNGMGIRATPPVGANVWIEFEQGDPNRPIWSGGFWTNAGEMPGGADLPGATIRLQTMSQSALTISDLPDGGIALRSATGATIVVDATGIRIDNGQGASIVMVGPTVTINGGALAIT
jgi:uncharacterized protein involved in type VI secretion and phage assembly